MIRLVENREGNTRMSSNTTLEDQVASRLSELGFRFAEHPIAMGLYPDFLIGLSDNRNVIVEVKDSHLIDQNAAVKQLDRYITLLGAVGGFLVVGESRSPEMVGDRVSLIGLNELPQALARLRAT